MNFVLQRGSDRPVKLEHSYGRRAQSVVYSLQWKDVAIINSDTQNEAIEMAKTAIAEWKIPGQWQLEGRGNIAGTTIKI